MSHTAAILEGLQPIRFEDQNKLLYRPYESPPLFSALHNIAMLMTTFVNSTVSKFTSTAM